MRRLQLWLREDDRTDTYFIKDLLDLDDPFHKDRFAHRTFSDIDKFEEGYFLTNQELEAVAREAYSAGYMDAENSYYGAHPEKLTPAIEKDFKNYWSNRAQK